MTKWVYSFGNGKAEGSADMMDLLGGKGAGLAEMNRIGLAVPPGFTITTELCYHYLNEQSSFPSALINQVDAALEEIGNATGKTYGDVDNPLLLSVRSGSRASMPGMMDTVLNLGLNDQSVGALAAETSDSRFAYDTYRRFVQIFASIVMGVDHVLFEEALDDLRARRDVEFDGELGVEDWKAAIFDYQQIILNETGTSFPQDAREQLWSAVDAVLKSWMSPRAVTYRALHNIAEDEGTAVNIQAMVFGNSGGNSAAGVAFTRNPSTGENYLFGEYLPNAQGEDVVAGIRTPCFLTERGRIAAGSDDQSLEKMLPDNFEEFAGILQRLEQHYLEMQDVEFTIENGKLWLLQTRKGKCTTKAALRIATEMVSEGLISRQQAVARIDTDAIARMISQIIDPKAVQDIFARGLPASPGAAHGKIVFSSDEAVKARAEGHKIILVRKETSPHDVAGMHAASAILTSGGGMTSHAAVVARSMGKPCVCGAMSLRIDYGKATMSSLGRELGTDDEITIDGANGTVLLGKLPLIKPEPTGDLAKIVEWANADKY